MMFAQSIRPETEGPRKRIYPKFRSCRDEKHVTHCQRLTLTRPLGTLSHEEREPKKLDGLSPRPLGEGPGVRVWS